MNKSESIKEIATALCKFQGEVGKIKKGETNPFFKSKYASLADILDVIRQPLVNNGLSFVQFPTQEHSLTTMLMHTSGEWMEASYSMTPAKNDPQGLGSVITYQRRYALGAVLGLNIDDDDGNAASTPQKSDANFSAMTPKKQILSEAVFAKILARAGEPELWQKVENAFQLTTEQATRLQFEIKNAKTKEVA